MKHALVKAILCGLILSVGALGAFTTASATTTLTKEAVAQLIEQAEQARAQAAEVGGEWRDTAKLIKGAQGALKAGELASAAKTALRAKRQGELGYQQAVSQKELKLPSYLKY